MSRTLAVMALCLVLAACSDSSLSMSEYGDRLNEIRGTYEPQAEVVQVEYLQVPQPTLEDLRIFIGREVAIRTEIEDAIRALDPPDEIADLHDLLADWITALRQAGEGLRDRVGTVAGWDDFFDSAEYRTFETTLTGGTVVCDEFQAKLDATAARGVFADMPWIPSEMKEVVDAVIGCDTIPEDVDDVFRR
jgi:hypothetical protein